MTDGLFVTVEGIDGAGKTTVVEAIQDEFGDVVRTQEPSELWTGRQVRRAISNDTDAVHPFATFYLFMADRVHHIDKEIRPAVEEGKIVVSDRYADSTLAYQPVALSDYLSYPQQYMVAVMDPWSYEPDLTLFLDIDVDTALGRMDGTEEYENRDFLEGVHANYQELARQFSERYVRINGAQTKADVTEEALSAIREAYDEA